MATVVIVVLVVALVALLVHRLRFHGTGIVARRGLSIGADLAGLADAPRVRVITVTRLGPDRVRLVLAPAPPAAPVIDPAPAGPAGAAGAAAPHMDVIVELGEDEFGVGLLHRWRDADSSLGLVIPEGSRLLRLRSFDDLQHLTLRRIDQD